MRGIPSLVHRMYPGPPAVLFQNWVAIDILSLKNDALYFPTRRPEEPGAGWCKADRHAPKDVACAGEGIILMTRMM